MSISSVSSATSQIAVPLVSVSAATLETATAEMAAIIETPGQIQYQIDQLEQEALSQAMPQVALEIQQLQQAQQVQLKEAESAGTVGFESDPKAQAAVAAPRLETRV